MTCWDSSIVPVPTATFRVEVRSGSGAGNRTGRSDWISGLESCSEGSCALEAEAKNIPARQTIATQQICCQRVSQQVRSHCFKVLFLLMTAWRKRGCQKHRVDRHRLARFVLAFATNRPELLFRHRDRTDAKAKFVAYLDGLTQGNPAIAYFQRKHVFT